MVWFFCRCFSALGGGEGLWSRCLDLSVVVRMIAVEVAVVGVWLWVWTDEWSGVYLDSCIDGLVEDDAQWCGFFCRCSSALGGEVGAGASTWSHLACFALRIWLGTNNLFWVFLFFLIVDGFL